VVNPSSRSPIEYEIILDASGSMSWNFAGQGMRNGRILQCTNPGSTCSGADAWNPVQERRIYIVKQALKSLIDQMGPNDVMRITGLAGNLGQNFSNQLAINALTRTLPSGGWSSDKVVLKAAVDLTGSVNNDPYRTDGLAPSATGFAAAAQVLATAPITSPISGETYERNVIFLTDSVANVFLDGERNFALDIAACAGNPDVINIAACQVGATATGRLRPLSALIDQANALKQSDHAPTIYVVALAGVDETGLRNVASQSMAPFFSASTNPGDLQAILDDITTNITYGDCIPAGGNQWVDQIDAQHTPSFPPPNTLPDGVFGYVYLYDENGLPLPDGQHTLPLVQDPLSGTLIFELPQSQGLAPGVYQLQAFAGYKGEDGVSRVYDGLFDPNTELINTSQVFVFDPSSALGPVIPLSPVYLDLRGSVCS
jgi:hypothetical protein